LSLGDCAIPGAGRKKLAAQKSDKESEMTVDMTLLYQCTKTSHTKAAKAKPEIAARRLMSDFTFHL
jgi:hypothetical protein